MYQDELPVTLPIAHRDPAAPTGAPADDALPPPPAMPDFGPPLPPTSAPPVIPGYGPPAMPTFRPPAMPAYVPPAIPPGAPDVPGQPPVFRQVALPTPQRGDPRSLLVGSAVTSACGGLIGLLSTVMPWLAISAIVLISVAVGGCNGGTVTEQQTRTFDLSGVTMVFTPPHYLAGSWLPSMIVVVFGTSLVILGGSVALQFVRASAYLPLLLVLGLCELINLAASIAFSIGLNNVIITTKDLGLNPQTTVSTSFGVGAGFIVDLLAMLGAVIGTLIGVAFLARQRRLTPAGGIPDG